MRVGIDIDGTVYPWTLAANQAVMSRYPETADPGEHPSWDYLKTYLGNDDRWRWIWSYDAAPQVWGREDLIFDGAQKIVNDLAARHEVHFVTHRNPQKAGEMTARWLRAHFSGYKGVHVLDNSVAKHDLLDWDVFIDDKPETLDGFRVNKPDVLTIMPVREWNAHRLNDCARSTFYRWEAVPTILEEVFA